MTPTPDPAALRPDLDRNDLVYHSPPIHGHQGWLLGAEGAGATVWNPADAVRVQFGHTDLIDRGDPGSKDAERPRVTPCVRHAGQLQLSIDGTPLFEPLDLVEYSARLSLGDGELQASGRSTWGSFSFEAIYGSDPAVFRLTYRDALAEPASRELRLQRRHSRVISNPWAWIVDDAGGAADDARAATRADVEDGIWRITYRDAGFESALAFHIEDAGAGGARIAPDARDFGLRLRIPAARSSSIAVRVAVGVARDGRTALEDAVAALKRSLASPVDGWLAASRNKRRAAYAPFSIELPQDRYWEQLWYLGRYHLRASGEGRLPAFFINGPWGWRRDVRAWARCWYHWNMHGAHLSIPSLGEWDLFRPYADWRMRQVEVYREVTERVFGVPGVAFQDQQLPDGGTWTSVRDRPMNKYFLATGTQTALHFYRQWRFTRDDGFLHAVVLPYFREVVRFWREYLEEDESGALHVPRSVPYEYHADKLFRDCLTDLELLRTALPAFAHAAAEAGAEQELADWARAAADRLATTPVLPVSADFVTQMDAAGSRVYDNPFFHGQAHSPDDRVDAIGWSEEVQRWVTHSETHQHGIGKYGVFCSAQTAGIYPAENITSDAAPAWRDATGAGDDARAKWDRSRNALRSIRRYPVDESAPDKSDVAEPRIAWTGHSLELPAFARLGLTEELRKAMDFYIDRYQIFPQGMFNYHPRQRWFGNHSMPSSSSGEALRIEHDPFALHFAFEPQGIFGEALTLALLDCAGGVIRLFPAYARDARFTLPARDGFSVTAEQKDGRLMPLHIHSRRGGVCRIRVPWRRAKLITAGAGTDAVLALHPEKSVVSFDTVAAGTCIVADADSTESGAAPAAAPPTAPQQETAPKAFNRHAVLGLPKRM